ncbi:general transcription factor 3C polypeptide 6 protein [Dioscorea alata]|uniref:General transcription factor 3C polypeptide 6 protein n=2 Tax=Dioscorea alata TaxID=55571 RepID=A0ACB7UMI3_DIOAL|nr:general transcription factor 3C polypeptide 6 protein [Dioscorea alata]KAH7661676.1 general transcription factor 3C polypeptide 6 protein [Dioscorea alata]
MEVNLRQNGQANVEEEDYLLLDLDSVCLHADIPANASYVLSGLDTPHPVLTIANHLKLIGEYQETIGTCYVFSERESVPQLMHSENHMSETNFPKDTSIAGSTQVPAKEVKLITGLNGVLKFRLASEDESEYANRSHVENDKNGCCNPSEKKKYSL